MFKNRQHHPPFLIRLPGSELNAAFRLWHRHRSFSTSLEKVRCHCFSWLHCSFQAPLGSSPVSLLSGSESNFCLRLWRVHLCGSIGGTLVPALSPFPKPITIRARSGKDHRLGLTLRSTRTQPAPAGSSNNFPGFFAPVKIMSPAGPVNFFR